MIVFAPAYDAATRANLLLAQELVDAECVALFADDARGPRLRAALTERPGAPLFAMSHGRSERLLAQDGDCAMDADDIAWIGERPIFAFACRTAERLGPSAAPVCGMYWGYTGAIQAPEEDARFTPVFLPIYRYIRAHWRTARSAEDRGAMLETIARMCEQASALLDELSATDPEIDWRALSAQMCLRHIWDRLRIWIGAQDTPEMHPHAGKPVLFR